MPADLRLRAQIQLILNVHSDAAVFPEDWEDTGEVDYIYRKNAILSREPDVGRVIESLDRNFPVEEERERAQRYEFRRVSSGVQRLELRGLPPVPVVLDVLDADLGVGVATPDALLYASPYPCPATEPTEVPLGTVDPFPPPVSRVSCCHPDHCDPRPGCDGDGVSVSIADTGLLPDAAEHHPWLAGVVGAPEDAYDPASHHIRPYAGHGTFVAGCLRCMAPRARVFIVKAFDVSAESFETDLVPVLDEAVSRSPDIFVFTFCTSTRKNLQLLTFEDFYERRIRHMKGLVTLAPAGNDGQSRVVWPAAFPWVVSVGALSASWRDRAHFSNHGGWVDVYAPGENLVNAFARGTYVCDEPPVGEQRHFHGMAMWSGTSFSTPIVAGLIAARMSATGENGRLAADSLLRLARSQAIKGVGAALYPGQACCNPGHSRHLECSRPSSQDARS